jgi:hypothetical protein
LKGLAACDDIRSPHQAAWGKTNWTQLKDKSYYELIAQLREALPAGAPFWTIEKYWQPSPDLDHNV